MDVSRMDGAERMRPTDSKIWRDGVDANFDDAAAGGMMLDHDDTWATLPPGAGVASLDGGQPHFYHEINTTFHVKGGTVINLKDIHSLSEFQRNTRAHVEHLRSTGRPEVLTVNGQAELVVQHAEAYQKLLDLAANAAAIVRIQRGLQGMYEGTGDDAEDAFASLERELGISERA
jgi:hypothetical protein